MFQYLYHVCKSTASGNKEINGCFFSRKQVSLFKENFLLHYKTKLLQFQEKGEKSGWTYIAITEEQAGKLNPGTRKSFRVKGQIDHYTFEGLNVLPMGDGSFILPVNGSIRKVLQKQKDDEVLVTLSFQEKSYELALDFLACLQDEPPALQFLNTLPLSHRNYFSKWIESAKTEPTRVKRISMAINALSKNMGFSDMIRFHQKTK